MRMITILIVDPHTVVRHGLSSWLAAIPDLDVIGLASDGQEGVDKCEALQPDVVLMDIATPVRNGVEAIAQIRERWPEIAVIAFTATVDGEVVNAAFAAGAMGYLLKDVAPETLVASVRSVLEGGLPLSPLVAAHLFTVHRSPRSIYDTLSRRERQVLDMIARGDQNKEIAVALGISDNTVRVYCSSLFHRLGVTGRTQAAVWATRTLRTA
jgi:DNA-binding NarL/FixJ family response regulator